MKIVEPSVEVLTPVDPPALMARLERAGRICYRSEKRIGPDTAAAFVRTILKSGHHSVIEHESLSARLVCDRGVTHELVRHRLASFSQESTRYVNYGRTAQRRGMTVIRPLFFSEGSSRWNIWLRAMEASEKAYLDLIEDGATPQEARSVLPNSLKTEIVMTANLREWRHVFELRCAPASHPQMREIMKMLLAVFNSLLPELFGELAGRFETAPSR